MSPLIFKMAQIHNSDLTKELKEGGKLQQLRDVIPSQLADKVVPVMEVNPKLLRRSEIIKNSVATNATSATIYTVPSDKIFYITACGLGVIKDATATSLSSRIQIYTNGVAAQILTIPGLTLTAQSDVVSVSFPFPIKVDSGTAIAIQNNTNVGNVTAAGWVCGYLIENMNA